MSQTQQNIVQALTTLFSTAIGEKVYDTSAPYDEPTPCIVLAITSDVPSNAFPVGPDNTDHNITFTLEFYRQRANGPAALRAMGELALTLSATKVPTTNDGDTGLYCTDRGGVRVDDNNMLVLTQTWTYQGGF
jgi:hypothetical protein